ncbi:aminoglycoside phosphotransferase [Streptosporangium sp. NPDC000563]|uniref:aminoglycoside phosphotransferase n=1 Tax=Streptosporangium sp. NPDC000563 TaxID=3154366 RepID=UPI003325486E
MSSQHRAPGSGQRAFLRRILAEGAQRLGVSPAGETVFGWHDRTIGSPALTDTDTLWLRATGEHRDWAHGEAWTGNQDASAITDVPKPAVIARVDWDEPPVSMYAELLTYVPDPPCSATPELTAPPIVPAAWWSDLRTAMEALAVYPTDRGDHDPSALPQRVEAFYRRPLALPSPPTTRTEHTDLHWANLTYPRLWILDWEYWGNAPAGYGAATLYLHSLLVPDTAAHVHDLFADLLDTPTGRLAQLSAAAHILDRAGRSGDYPTLAALVRAHAARLIQPAGRR